MTKAQKPITTTNALLKRAREQRNWSQEALAEKLDTTGQTVSRWERGAAAPTPYYRQQLCALLGMTPQELGLLPAQAPAWPQGSAGPDHTGRWPPGPVRDPAVPLPAAQGSRLIGRDLLLADLKGRLATAVGGDYTALCGLPGVGKTALAVALARDERVQARFPDGVLWAGLGPSATAQGQLSRWGALLGLPDRERALAGERSVEERGLALRTAIGERALLLVLDDAWRLEDALTLRVGGSTCAYLVTTRFADIAAQLAGEGVAVPELPEEDGLALLARLAPRAVAAEPETAAALVRAVGGLPLGLTLMGCRITLRQLIGTSLDLLSAASSTALLALSVFPPKPNTFSEEAALAVTGAPIAAVDRLSDAGLLESSGPGRYTLHQTIADYARLALAQGGEDQAPARRLVAYFAGYVREHRTHYDSLELERANVFAALQVAFEREMQGELLRIATDFFPFLAARGLYASAREHLTRALEGARAAGGAPEEAQVLLHLADTAQKQGDYTRAIDFCQEGLALARAMGQRSLITDLLQILGWVIGNQGDLIQAEAYLQEGLALARQFSLQEQLCSILFSLGSLAGLSTGDYSSGEAYFREGLEIARQLGLHERVCATLTGMGVMAGLRGDYALAEAYYQEGLALARAMGFRERISVFLLNLGEQAYEQGNFIQAEAYYQEGLALARAMGHAELTTVLLLNLGELTHERGDHAQAEAYAQEGLALARAMGFRDRISGLLLALGRAVQLAGDGARAEGIYQEGLALAREIGKPEKIITLHMALGVLATERGDDGRAEDLLQEGLALARAGGYPLLTCDLLYHLGWLSLKQQRIEEAGSRFREMQENIPRGGQKLNAQLHYGLARLAEARGDFEEARRLGVYSLSLFELIGHRIAGEVRGWLASVGP